MRQRPEQASSSSVFTPSQGGNAEATGSQGGPWLTPRPPLRPSITAVSLPDSRAKSIPSGSQVTSILLPAARPAADSSQQRWFIFFEKQKKKPKNPQNRKLTIQDALGKDKSQYPHALLRSIPPQLCSLCFLRPVPPWLSLLCARAEVQHLPQS